MTEPAHVTIETERLVLRAWREDDAAALYKYAQDADVGPAAGWEPHTSVEESRELISRVLSGAEDYAITIKANGDEPVGSISLMPVTRDERPKTELELGFWIGKPYWGRGLMPEAARALVRHGFEDLRLDAVWCGYYEGNEKSRRTQEKIGFRFHHEVEHALDRRGIDRREVMQVMTRAQWEEMR